MQGKKKRNKLKAVFDIRYIFYDFAKVTATIPIHFLYRIKVHYSNTPKKELINEPAIIISNHIGYLDIAAISKVFATRRICFLAKRQLYESFLGNIFFTGVKAIRTNAEDIEVKTFKKAKYEFDRGHMLGVFPEGHLKRQQEMDKFKCGIALLAYYCDAPIIPICLEEKEKLTSRQNILLGDKIYVKDYIKTDNPTMQDFEEFTNFLYENELKLQKALNERIKKTV